MAESMIFDPLELAGRTLAGTYKVLQPIGAGGFGVVYRAVHMMLNRQVAVKVQRATLGIQGQLIERFRREAEACWRLRNAGAVEVYDCRIDPDTGRLFFAMELLRGRSLATYWLLARRLPAEEAVRFVVCVARCMAVAHDHGIIHRDLKPENIFLCEDGSVRILDFGSALMLNAARLTKPGEFLGTTCYMPEEQLVRPTGDLDGRADIYALGVVLYHLLSGKMLYAPNQDLRVLRGRILREDPRDIKSVAPFVTDEVARVIRRALARDREARPATMRDFIDELQRASGVTLLMSIGGGAESKPVLKPTLESAPSPSLLDICSSGDGEDSKKTVEHNTPVLIENLDKTPLAAGAPPSASRPATSAEKLPATVVLRKPAEVRPRPVQAPEMLERSVEPIADRRTKWRSRAGIALLGVIVVVAGVGFVSSRTTGPAGHRVAVRTSEQLPAQSAAPRPSLDASIHLEPAASPGIGVVELPMAQPHDDEPAFARRLPASAQSPTVQIPNHRKRSVTTSQEAPAKTQTTVKNADLIAPEF